MQFNSDSGDWIFGFQSSGGPKDSDDSSASISQHSQKGAFAWEFAAAKGGSSVNPLIATAPSGTSGGSATAGSCIPRSASATASGASGGASPTQTSDDDDTDDDDHQWWTGSGHPTARPTARPTSWPPAKRQEQLPFCDELPTQTGGGTNGTNGSSNAGFTPIGSSGGSGNTRLMLIAHGILASLAFVILFPAGAIAIRLASFPGVVWLHAAFQIFAYLVYIAAFGLGVYLATEMKLLDHYHPIIGIVVLVLIFFQPILGWMHHALFKKYQHRTIWSYAHIWVGRIAVTLGIINGGLGLKLADSMGMSSRGGIIAYGVVAGLMWLAWVAASVVGERRRKSRGVAVGEGPPKYEGRRESDRSEVSTAPVNGHYAPKER
jgi:hypothetical protein